MQRSFALIDDDGGELDLIVEDDKQYAFLFPLFSPANVAKYDEQRKESGVAFLTKALDKLGIKDKYIYANYARRLLPVLAHAMGAGPFAKTQPIARSTEPAGPPTKGGAKK